jgi:ribonuclease P protein component
VLELTVFVRVSLLRLVGSFLSAAASRAAPKSQVCNFRQSFKKHGQENGGVFCIIKVMIPAPFRFHGHNSLRYVYGNGKAVRSRMATIKWVANKHRHKSRVAVVVSKKVIKSAVSRNRIRRRIYEFIRLQLPRFDKTSDVVVIVTSSEFLTMPATDLTEQLSQLLDQTDLFKKQ